MCSANDESHLEKKNGEHSLIASIQDSELERYLLQEDCNNEKDWMHHFDPEKNGSLKSGNTMLSMSFDNSANKLM